jgi:hypothetical protein
VHHPEALIARADEMRGAMMRDHARTTMFSRARPFGLLAIIIAGAGCGAQVDLPDSQGEASTDSPLETGPIGTESDATDAPWRDALIDGGDGIPSGDTAMFDTGRPDANDCVAIVAPVCAVSGGNAYFYANACVAAAAGADVVPNSQCISRTAGRPEFCYTNGGPCGTMIDTRCCFVSRLCLPEYQFDCPP